MRGLDRRGGDEWKAGRQSRFAASERGPAKAGRVPFPGKKTPRSAMAPPAKAKPAPAPAPAAEVVAKPAPAEQLDGEGRPYITLIQFLKLSRLAESGGQAKVQVRAGGIVVNGAEELRPTRKLHAGDVVTIAGHDYDIALGG